jgi:hypothetical protein
MTNGGLKFDILGKVIMVAIFLVIATALAPLVNQSAQTLAMQPATTGGFNIGQLAYLIPLMYYIAIALGAISPFLGEIMAAVDRFK